MHDKSRRVTRSISRRSNAESSSATTPTITPSTTTPSTSITNNNSTPRQLLPQATRPTPPRSALSVLHPHRLRHRQLTNTNNNNNNTTTTTTEAAADDNVPTTTLIVGVDGTSIQSNSSWRRPNNHITTVNNENGIRPTTNHERSSERSPVAIATPTAAPNRTQLINLITSLQQRPPIPNFDDSMVTRLPTNERSSSSSSSSGITTALRRQHLSNVTSATTNNTTTNGEHEVRTSPLYRNSTRPLGRHAQRHAERTQLRQYSLLNRTDTDVQFIHGPFMLDLSTMVNNANNANIRINNYLNNNPPSITTQQNFDVYSFVRTNPNSENDENENDDIANTILLSSPSSASNQTSVGNNTATTREIFVITDDDSSDDFHLVLPLRRATTTAHQPLPITRPLHHDSMITNSSAQFIPRGNRNNHTNNNLNIAVNDRHSLENREIGAGIPRPEIRSRYAFNEIYDDYTAGENITYQNLRDHPHIQAVDNRTIFESYRTSQRQQRRRENVEDYTRRILASPGFAELDPDSALIGTNVNNADDYLVNVESFRLYNPRYDYENLRNKRVIQSLHTSTFDRSSNKFHDVTCGICLDSFIPECTVLEMNPCKHIFHKDCVIPWLFKGLSCPFCRSAVIEPPIVI